MQHTKPGFKSALRALWGAIIGVCELTNDVVSTTRRGVQGVDYYVQQFEAGAKADFEISKVEAEAEYAKALAVLEGSKPKLTKETA